MDNEVQDIYQVSILDDLKKLGGLSHPVRSNLIERCIVKKASLKNLHANPEDEFSNPDIGPNFEIVGKYRTEFIKCRMMHVKPEVEPLVVEKLSTGGFRVLNGHHRWMAAMMSGMKRIKVELVNTVPATRIVSTIQKSANDRCISFDLDEVIRCEGKSVEADKSPAFPFNLFYPERVRRSIGPCITELGKLGFDVWVYTGSYLSSEHIISLMKRHGARITGVINGMKQKKPDDRISNAFRSKYKVIVHADNAGLLWVDPGKKDFDDIPISPDDDWASQVHQRIQERIK